MSIPDPVVNPAPMEVVSDAPAVKPNFLRRASAIITSGVGTKGTSPVNAPVVKPDNLSSQPYGSSTKPADILYSALSTGITILKHGMCVNGCDILQDIMLCTMSTMHYTLYEIRVCVVNL